MNGDDTFGLDANDELGLGIGSDVNEEVKHNLEKQYTGQYKTHKRKNKRKIFTEVQKETSNLACLKFHHLQNADGIIPNSIRDYSKNLDSWGWSSVLTSVLTGGKPLRGTLYQIFTSYEFFQKGLADEKQFYGFGDLLERAYQKNKNSYHNSTHATDVLQTVHHMINATGLYHWLSDLELMAMLFAAAIHDAEHTGTTNDFHVSTRSPLAILYNDQSVLENHHLSVTWDILKTPDCNILSKLDTSEETYFRELVQEMVLATDMSLHFSALNDIKHTIETTPAEYWHDVLEDKADYPSQLEKPKIMSLMIHAADISNAFKTWHIHHYTTMQLLQEFFNQGDMCKLKGMAPPPLCDRRKTDIPLSQINFAKSIDTKVSSLTSKLTRLTQSQFPLGTNQVAQFKRLTFFFVCLPSTDETMRLLAQVFLPQTQNQQKKDSTGPNIGGMLSVGIQNNNKFKKHSLRPNTCSMAASTVIDACDKFDKTWQSCMKDNQRRWDKIIAQSKSEEELRSSCQSDNVNNTVSIKIGTKKPETSSRNDCDIELDVELDLNKWSQSIKSSIISAGRSSDILEFNESPPPIEEVEASAHDDREIDRDHSNLSSSPVEYQHPDSINSSRISAGRNSTIHSYEIVTGNKYLSVVLPRSRIDE